MPPGDTYVFHQYILKPINHCSLRTGVNDYFNMFFFVCLFVSNVHEAAVLQTNSPDKKESTGAKRSIAMNQDTEMEQRGGELQAGKRLLHSATVH